MHPSHPKKITKFSVKQLTIHSFAVSMKDNIFLEQDQPPQLITTQKHSLWKKKTQTTQPSKGHTKHREEPINNTWFSTYPIDRKEDVKLDDITTQSTPEYQHPGALKTEKLEVDIPSISLPFFWKNREKNRHEKKMYIPVVSILKQEMIYSPLEILFSFYFSCRFSQLDCNGLCMVWPGPAHPSHLIKPRPHEAAPPPCSASRPIEEKKGFQNKIFCFYYTKQTGG